MNFAKVAHQIRCNSSMFQDFQGGQNILRAELFATLEAFRLFFNFRQFVGL